ncbi:AraC family transcriptional regulator [Mycolicibacterium sp. YH-1]|uniref:AraC family transcriptional regulator n=1 Tax=Mycolicibacterium sp. YH-1 TaxID=2908837 RepID=UPI001F4C5159|nr:AraC family transcriptional regulator [Mycolicibacterium sp. YH-1]UNB55835.1 AraC family transcriptional regulator [Mycolicibacterium sp. YH-1]
MALDPRLDDAVIPPSVLAGVVEIGQREGLPVGPWCSATGISPEQLVTSDSIKVSFRQAAMILRRAVRAIPDRPLGMQVGGRDVLLTFGMLGVAMQSCATVADAMVLGIDLHQASGSLVDIDVEVIGAEVVLSVHERAPEPELITFLCEEALCSTWLFIRSVFGTSISPKYVELAYPAPSYERKYRQVFGCPVQFGAPANRMAFNSSVLDDPFPAHHEPTRVAAIDACRRLLDLEGARSDITVAIEALLTQNLRRPVTMAEAADHLNVTERTLRRQLDAAGERFSTVRDRVRERRATFLLRESTLTVDAIARQVGFSEAREFRRAYVRWTGHPPTYQRRVKRL